VRDLLGKLLLAAASCSLVALVIVATELLVRRLAPAYLVETRGIHVFSPEYGWIGRPGAVAAMGNGRVTLNRLGYRGRELPPRREGGPTRVVVIGDSIAFGYGVADEQTFAHLLDTRDNGIAAANMGVQGFGPGQELLFPGMDQGRVDPEVAGQFVDRPVATEGGQGDLGPERRRVLLALACHRSPFPGPRV